MIEPRGPYLVIWEDSHSPESSSWIRGDEIDDSRIDVRSVGWIIKENRHTITLAAHVTPQGQFYGVMTVPRSAIRRRPKRLR